jgi:hypothetical protein
MAGKYRQRGISMFTLIFILAVLGGVGAMVMQAFPSMVEYQASLKLINRIKDEATVAAVRTAFDRGTEVDNITSLTGKDLNIRKEGDQTVISFAYSKEYHMFGPAWLTLKYEGESRRGR